MTAPLLEICVDDVPAAVAAEDAGAQRVELCAALAVGGVTPSRGAVEAALAALSVPLVVLVRPRRGDFVFGDRELDVMERDVRHAREAGAEAVALGCLTAAGAVDVEGTARLVAAARPMRVAFHRAFDHARDPEAALDALLELGVERVLTSGGRATAAEGAAVLARLVARAGERLTVVAAGGVRSSGARDLVRASGVRELHASAGAVVRGAARHWNPAVPLDAPTPLAGDARAAPDPREVAALRACLADVACEAP